MIQLSPSPVVHLELHTGNLARACSFYSRVCGWRLEQVEIGDCSYRAFDWGGGLEGGVVEFGASRAVWIPHLDVSRIDESAECRRRFGASGLLEPLGGAAGWRSVVRVPEGGEIAFWQSKSRSDSR
jgi:predicted enzyme related to lactoylglutathione lyase